MTRVFAPTILKTKQEILDALKKGELKSSKYHALNEDQQLFVELVCFGNYSAGAAMKVIKPFLKDPYAAGFRMAHNEDIIDVMEELTYKRDKMWMARITGKRDMALEAMEYVMKTTDDDALKVATAKAIIEAADKSLKSNQRVDPDQITGITLDISFSGGGVKNDVIDGEFSEEDEVVMVDKEKTESTGMPYQLDYADNINDSYEKKD